MTLSDIAVALILLAGLVVLSLAAISGGSFPMVGDGLRWIAAIVAVGLIGATAWKMG